MDSATPSADQLSELQELVLAAFERARASGKRDWQAMNVAVLKNRLLQITNGEFSHERYHATTMRQLVGRLPPELVELRPGPPATVHLLDENAVAPAPVQPPLQQAPTLPPTGEMPWRRIRIRDDLWNAMLDYRGGEIYVLDPQSGLARPKEVTDSNLPEFPTVTESTVQQWRHEFAENLALPAKAEKQSQLRAWAEGDGRMDDLPREFRGKWAESIKEHITSTLTAWFAANSIPVPADMHVAAESRGATNSVAIEQVVETRRLRNTLVHALSLMSFEEMAALPIPAGVVAKMSDRGK